MLTTFVCSKSQCSPNIRNGEMSKRHKENLRAFYFQDELMHRLTID